MTRRRRPSTTPYGRGPPPHGFATGRIGNGSSPPRNSLSRSRGILPAYPRSVAPTFAAAATILSAIAFSSASVKLFSCGCNSTSTARLT